LSLFLATADDGADLRSEDVAVAWLKVPATTANSHAAQNLGRW
jgi:hypothetical protein